MNRHGTAAPSFHASIQVAVTKWKGVVPLTPPRAGTPRAWEERTPISLGNTTQAVERFPFRSKISNEHIISEHRSPELLRSVEGWGNMYRSLEKKYKGEHMSKVPATCEV